MCKFQVEENLKPDFYSGKTGFRSAYLSDIMYGNERLFEKNGQYIPW